MTVCDSFIEPLNLQCLLVNTLSESATIFLGLFVLFLSGLAAYFKMPSPIFFMAIGIFSLIVYSFLSINIFFILFLIIGSLLITWAVNKIWKN